MLFDRECLNCDHIERDRLEWVDLGDKAWCPVCNWKMFVKMPCSPSLVYVHGSGESALEMATVMDQMREKSSAGHGNTTIKATAGPNGLTIDDIVTTKKG